MRDINELIQYHQESEFLDFKLEEYKDAKRMDLVKDVLAMANAAYSGDRYIIIGIKKNKDEIIFKAVDNPIDSASIQQLIHSNITPEISVTYEPFLFENKSLMVLTIKATADQPYSILKDTPLNEKTVLKKNTMLIRKGSYQVLMGRTDMEQIFAKKFKVKNLDDQIELGFKEGGHILKMLCIRNIFTPSDDNKKQIEDQIHWKEELLQQDPKKYVERFGQQTGLQNSYQEMNLPTLNSRLQSVKQNYQEEDQYYLNEERAFKLNFYILNHAEIHLDRAMIELYIPKIEGFKVMPRIQPRVINYIVVIPVEEGYPKVTTEAEGYRVSSDIGDVRHQLKHLAFKAPLRVFPDEKLAGSHCIIKVKLHGANLSVPREFDMRIDFI
ncbi:ATP-binding protein [Mucilaginibacter sp. HC2]|uniref:AlbA family DNA-binding domain-containing protein n=1 Tax=Mucilaginibacter inviolabilis TaxID=2714892 RepID=UPI0014088D09|nr:ATP-binding protein [Mucilaginibacter inviolabilis]NHA05464.1 ATP-binding protein [Mucilaginibacter inviolabilis]